MPLARQKFIGTAILCGLLALGCLPVRAQQSAPQAAAGRQQPSDIDVLEQPTYKRIMMSCMQKAVNPPVLQSGQHVDPSLFVMDGDKLAAIKKCMVDKGFPMPAPTPTPAPAQQYSQTGGDSRNAVPPPRVPAVPPAYAPPAGASGNVAAPTSSAVPPVNQTPPANKGTPHLWVVPQSQ
jgi:hypothetical protein